VSKIIFVSIAFGLAIGVGIILIDFINTLIDYLTKGKRKGYYR